MNSIGCTSDASKMNLGTNSSWFNQCTIAPPVASKRSGGIPNNHDSGLPPRVSGPPSVCRPALWLDQSKISYQWRGEVDRILFFVCPHRPPRRHYPTKWKERGTGKIWISSEQVQKKIHKYPPIWELTRIIWENPEKSRNSQKLPENLLNINTKPIQKPIQKFGYNPDYSTSISNRIIGSQNHPSWAKFA